MAGDDNDAAMPEFKEPTGGGAIRRRFVRPGVGDRQA
jgi:hypothetical protein